jgi:hypothetical protein
MQRLGKHTSAVNTLPQQYKVRGTTIAMQRRGKRASTVERLCFLNGPSRGVIERTEKIV